MTPAGLLQELRMAQELVMALVEPLDEQACRRQYHPDLSPLGWHLGHCAFIESYWLQATVMQDKRFTEPVSELYTPALTPISERGARIPAPGVLVQWVIGMQSLNMDALTTPDSAIHDHPLMADDYLVHFLIQHYSQHYEIMLAILTQRALAHEGGGFQVENPFRESLPEPETVSIQPGHYRVGGTAPTAYDNELPAQQATLGPYSIARNPVTNSEYLAFMNTGGYQKETLWSDTGWQWLQQHAISSPVHWRRDSSRNWYGTGVRGAYEIDAEDVLHGISWHEATAYANWAGGRLPHEHQWEVACRLQHLEKTGRAWEWCENTFYPYDGFKTFPYDECSKPWFNHEYYSLRGGSFHTRPALKRVSFRNFYQADRRHIFAGLRLVY